ncbi:MAG: iron-sulfur cluster assembly accessory protein [Holosporaceae bacterium]|jgi:iron-sulfur cluster assembly protein|nr:iron-sulfur cluster assembly accessory protein [Holosporaceae bacterium]
MDKLLILTENAKDFIKKSMDEEKCEGVRVDVVPGGCCGMTYKLDFVKEVDSSDLLLEEDGLKVYVAPKAVMFVSGMTMDYVKTPMGGNVVFENPNARSSCGCGKSFRPDDSFGGGCGGGCC